MLENLNNNYFKGSKWLFNHFEDEIVEDDGVSHLVLILELKMNTYI